MLTAIRLLQLIVGCMLLKIVTAEQLKGASSHPTLTDASMASISNLLGKKAKNRDSVANMISKEDQSSIPIKENIVHDTFDRVKNKMVASRIIRHLWSPVSSNDLKEVNANDQWLVNRRKKTHRWKMKTVERKACKKCAQRHCSHQTKSSRHCCSKSKSSSSEFQPLKTKAAGFKFQTGVPARNNFNVVDSRRYFPYYGGNMQAKSLMPFVVDSYARPLMVANGLPTNVRPVQSTNVEYLRNVQNLARTASPVNIPRYPFQVPRQLPVSRAEPNGISGLINFNKALDIESKNWEQPFDKNYPENLQCCPISDQKEDVPSGSDRQDYSDYNLKIGNECKITSGDKDSIDFDEELLEDSSDEGAGKLAGPSDQSMDSAQDIDDDDNDDQQFSQASLYSDSADYHHDDYQDSVAAHDKSESSNLDGSDNDLYVNTNCEYNSLPQSNQNSECYDGDIGVIVADPNPNFSQWSSAPESADETNFPQKESLTRENKDGIIHNAQLLAALPPQAQTVLDEGGPQICLDYATPKDTSPNKLATSYNNAAIFPGVFSAPDAGQIMADSEKTDRIFKRRRKNLSHLLSDFMVSKKMKKNGTLEETTAENVQEFTYSPLVSLETTQNMLFSEMKEELKALETTKVSKGHFKNKNRFKFLKEKSSAKSSEINQ